MVYDRGSVLRSHSRLSHLLTVLMTRETKETMAGCKAYVISRAHDLPHMTDSLAKEFAHE